MKRTLLFLSLFGAGLVILVVTLGGLDALFLDYDKPVIEAQDIGDVAKVIDIARGGNRFELEMPPFWEGPVTRPYFLVQEDGTRLRVASSHLIMPETREFDEGVLSRNPDLTLFREDGTPWATLTGDLGTLYATGKLSTALADGDGPRPDSFHVTGRVVARVLDERGQVVLEVLTESLRMPFPDKDDAESEMPPIECPAPVTMRRADGSLELHATSATLDMKRHTLVMHGPIGIDSLTLSLRPDLESADDSPADEASSAEPPLKIRSNGDLVYRWQEREVGGKNPQPLNKLDDGQLTLSQDVRIDRGDLWILAHYVDAFIKRRLKVVGGGFKLKELKALGQDGAPVQFGLFEGAGTAGELLYQPDPQLLVLEGPVALDGLRIHRIGKPDLEVENVRARRQARLVGGPVAEADPGPQAWTLRLLGEAELLLPGLVGARADVVTLEVAEQEGETAAPTLTEPPPAPGFELRKLTLNRDALLDFERGAEQGTGRGDFIDVELQDAGEKVITITGTASLDLTGDARGPLAKAFLAGPEIVARIPDQDEAALDLTVEVLQSAWFDLRGSTPLDPSRSITDGPPTRLTVEPAGACRLVAHARSLEFSGRATYWTEGPDGLRRRLTCDHLTLKDLDGERPTVLARGRVEVRDPLQGLLVNADSLDLGEEWIALGQTAYAEVHLEGGGVARVWAETLRLNPTTRFLSANNRSGRARITAPESLTGHLLPGGGAIDATVDERSRTVELLARQILLVPAEAAAPTADGPADGAAPRKLSRLEAAGQVELTRELDGTHATGERLVVDLVHESLRLDGGDGVAATLRRPVTGQQDRWDSVDAEWLELEDGGDRGTIAPGAVFVFNPRSKSRNVGSGGALVLHTRGETVLEGAELNSRKGVEAVLEDEAGRFVGRAEWLTVELTDTLRNGGTPARVLARRDVYLEHPMFTATGALLVHDLVSEVFELKAGLEPCRVLGGSPMMPFPVKSRFRALRARARFGEPGIPLDDLQVEGLFAEPDEAMAAEVDR